MNDYSTKPFLLAVLIILFVTTPSLAQENMATVEVPVIENGQTQVIPEFADTSNWIRHDLLGGNRFRL
ncbi:MAG: hypothetical protein U5K69_10080 [Balneolaceae bacterium]|nr:hypothetical protein [Balneolaceae bacterium]